MRTQNRSRRGLVSLEAAVVVSTFLTLLMGGLDLGLAVYAYNALAEASRQGARQAVVHGKYAAPLMNSWGPTTYTAQANATNEISQAVAPYLAGVDPATVTVKLQWIDGNNHVESRVRCTVSMSYQPMMTVLFGNQSLALSATSTMPIAH